VRTIATRIAIDRLRGKRAEPVETEALERLPDSADSPELAHFRRTYHTEFKAAFEAALASLEVRERNVLRHHFVDGLTTDEIGALYDVHKTTAFRWLDGAREKLSKRTRAEFQQRVTALPQELDSILRLVQSQLDLSLSRVL
jgi:RNA polymerase sigma-70 factor (ECF subfamily)